jgi:hypothetical protein
MKENESKIAFISFHLFFRIGTFQRVTADSNQKFLSAMVHAFYGGLLKFSLSLPGPDHALARTGHTPVYNRDFYFWQELA